MVILVLALIAFLFSILSIKNDFSKGFRFWGNDDKAGTTVVIEETNSDAQIENLTDDSEKNEKSETDTEAKDGQDNTETTEPVPVSDKFENGKPANNIVEEKQTAEIHKDQK